MDGGRNRRFGLNTAAVHAGEAPDPATGASAPAIAMSTTFVADELGGFSAHDLTAESGYVYARWGNPTVRMLQSKIAALEETEACLCCASGMAAVAAVFFARLSSGDHLILSDVCYAGVAELARTTLPRMGIAVSIVDLSDLTAVAAAIRPETRLIHCETPANPILRLTDLAALSRIAHKAGAEVSCDSTFASPIVTKPAALGVDYVIHSLTKYIGGHGDALGGAVAGTAEKIAALSLEAGVHYGGVLSPFNAWLIARGAATLPIRMKAHGQTAQAVAEWLEGQPAVTKVLYPGLASHPQHALARRQMQGNSGMIAFQVFDKASGEALAARMIEELEIIHYAVSLGHHRSLITWIGTEAILESSFRLTGLQEDGYRAWAGDGVFRLSIGLEDAVDLIADLQSVLG
ncbi:MAG: PLP-dependent aspartate aminotransferase family protein [Pseudomonadota bacterium]